MPALVSCDRCDLSGKSLRPASCRTQPKSLGECSAKSMRRVSHACVCVYARVYALVLLCARARALVRTRLHLCVWCVCAREGGTAAALSAEAALWLRHTSSLHALCLLARMHDEA
eukprot:2281554-Pleurochrysis_carterae.AAC.2